MVAVIWWGDLSSGVHSFHHDSIVRLSYHAEFYSSCRWELCNQLHKALRIRF